MDLLCAGDRKVWNIGHCQQRADSASGSGGRSAPPGVAQY